MHRHTLEYYKCEICSQQFKEKRKMINHIKNLHKDKPPNKFEGSIDLSDLTTPFGTNVGQKQ